MYIHVTLRREGEGGVPEITSYGSRTRLVLRSCNQGSPLFFSGGLVGVVRDVGCGVYAFTRASIIFFFPFSFTMSGDVA